MKKLLFLLPFSAVLAGCFGDDDSNSGSALTEGSYAVQMVAADYGSSQVATGNIIGDRSVQNTVLTSAQSDYTVNSWKNYLYHIGRYSIDLISRYNASVSLSTPVWEYSTLEDGKSTSNPYKIVHSSDDTAYVIRYDSTNVWQVNPEAASAEDFHVGSIDLSAYTADGALYPRMSDALVYNNYLYVVMQRLDASYTPQTAYIAVIDLSDNSEVDTDPSTDGLQGIALNITNPMSMVENNGMLYVAGRGNYSTDNGGLDKIDTITYTVTNLINTDTLSSLNDAENSTYFHVYDVAVVSDTQGYVSVNIEQGWSTQSSIIYSFNPSTDSIGDVLNIEALTGAVISDINTDINNRLWVADSKNSELIVIDTDINAQNGDAIALPLPPGKVTFLTVE